MKNDKFQPKIVVLGGGTGLSVLLRGLKKYTPNLTAVVNVTDDGGSSGALRRELGVLPPGDIRNCLVALSEEENLMTKLFQYRFPSAGSLSGHSFGNLFLTAMSSLSGGFDSGVARASEVLAIRGQVLPVTLSSVTLKATLLNGKVVQGESKITGSDSPIKHLAINPASPPPGPNVIESIMSADGIVIGPGSLYTSIISNLLVRGVTRALKESRAPKIYISNLMTQPGETSGYKLSDHLETIEKYLGKNVINYIVANTKIIDKKVLKRYTKGNSAPVLVDKKKFGKSKLVKSNLVSATKEFVRHNSEKLAAKIIEIIKSHNR
ncbi:MAG: YvcK family protein [Elusimicrobia bacterium]|nr:YvcK family protein [Elusimicrobiota bacterium]